MCSRHLFRPHYFLEGAIGWRVGSGETVRSPERCIMRKPSPGLGFVNENNPLSFHWGSFHALVKTLLVIRRKLLKNGDSQGFTGGGRENHQSDNYGTLVQLRTGSKLLVGLSSMENRELLREKRRRDTGAVSSVGGYRWGSPIRA